MPLLAVVALHLAVIRVTQDCFVFDCCCYCCCILAVDLLLIMSSFFSQLMEPGGGVMLLPFVRMVIGCLLVLTTTAAIVGVARIHMVILSFLSGGLLLSLSFFESEYKKARGGGRGSASQVNESKSGKSAAKTD